MGTNHSIVFFWSVVRFQPWGPSCGRPTPLTSLMSNSLIRKNCAVHSSRNFSVEASRRLQLTESMIRVFVEFSILHLCELPTLVGSNGCGLTFEMSLSFARAQSCCFQECVVSQFFSTLCHQTCLKEKRNLAANCQLTESFKWDAQVCGERERERLYCFSQKCGLPLACDSSVGGIFFPSL